MKHTNPNYFVLLVFVTFATLVFSVYSMEPKKEVAASYKNSSTVRIGIVPGGCVIEAKDAQHLVGCRSLLPCPECVAIKLCLHKAAQVVDKSA